MYKDKDEAIQQLLHGEFGDYLLSFELEYCIYFGLSVKERQVVELLVEGYSDREIYNLLKKVFPTFHSYKMCKSHAKKKLLNFLL